MKNNEIMTLKLNRIQVIDVEMAINSIICDFKEEINNPKTDDERRKIANDSINRRWQPLLEAIQNQFVDQDK